MVLSSVWCQCTSSLLTQNNPKYDGVTKDGCHQNKWETKRPNNLIHGPWRVCSCCLLTENRRIIITISANNFRLIIIGAEYALKYLNAAIENKYLHDYWYPSMRSTIYKSSALVDCIITLLEILHPKRKLIQGWKYNFHCWSSKQN